MCELVCWPRRLFHEESIHDNSHWNQVLYRAQILKISAIGPATNERVDARVAHYLLGQPLESIKIELSLKRSQLRLIEVPDMSNKEDSELD